jgi:hypothetical protein
VNDYLKKCNEMQAEEDYSLETGTAVYNKESEKVRMCSDGLYRGKYRKAEREQVNNELVPTHSEKQVSSAPLSVDTIARFRSLYAQYPEQINYRIKFGSAMEKAQATVIRNIAVGAVAVE